MIQIKICGLTRVDEAVTCAKLGADAIGLVFYPQSPRNVSMDQAGEICAALPSHIAPVGVFVNETFSFIMERVRHCGLRVAQLHGQEPPELAQQLSDADVNVIKALFIGGKPDLSQAKDYQAADFLVECAKGKLPGGNAMTWDWSAAKDFGKDYSLVLAGGLNPDNVIEAVKAARPHAVDVSSGVEAAPGRKDADKARRFIESVKTINYDTNRRIFS